MLDQDFCTFLEYEITKAFANSKDDSLRHLWCDGVLLPVSENDLSKKNINEKRQISLTAFIGKDGQNKYELIVKFGSKSLSKYERGLDIRSCAPNPIENNYAIDQLNKTITIHLL